MEIIKAEVVDAYHLELSCPILIPSRKVPPGLTANLSDMGRKI
jgi:hypothetical protein